MYKVLLVDDEVLVRVGLRSAIRWEEQGYTVVGEAANGKDALARALELKPDLVITDIRMPEMDGLALLRALAVELPSAKGIVLTCYDAFQLVREALKLGACDYILKVTMEPADLMTALGRAREQLDRLRPARTDAGMPPAEPGDRTAYLRVLLKQVTTTPPAQADLRSLYESLNSGENAVLLVALDDLSQLEEDAATDLAQVSADAANIMADLLRQGQRGALVPYRQGRWAALLPAPAGSSPDCRPTAQALQEALKRYMNLSVSAGISRAAQGVSALPDLYREARRSLEARFYTGRGSLHAAAGPSAGVERQTTYTVETEAELEAAAERGDRPAVFDLLSACLRRAAAQHVPPAQCRELAAQLVHTLDRVARRRNSLPPEAADVSVRQLLEVEFFADLEPILLALTARYLDALAAGRGTGLRPEVQRAMEQVGRHLAHELSIPQAAAFVGLSESYFSHIFKKETGEGFVEYVNRMRVERACDLLRQSGMRAVDVAESVGYNNFNYFCKMFRRQVGCTPSQYKRAVDGTTVR